MNCYSTNRVIDVEFHIKSFYDYYNEKNNVRISAKQLSKMVVTLDLMCALMTIVSVTKDYDG